MDVFINKFQSAVSVINEYVSIYLYIYVYVYVYIYIWQQ